MRPRRTLLGLALALALTSPAAAVVKQVPAPIAFPFYDAYLKLPPAERARFRMVYTLRADGKPITAAFVLIDGEKRIPLKVRDGRVDRMPTLDQQQHGKIEMDQAEGVKFKIGVEFEAMARPAAKMDARELAVSVTDAATGMKKALGVLSMAFKTPKQVEFAGVASGEIEFADGHRAPLPVEDGHPVYNPTLTEGARTLRFPKTPTRLVISG